MKRSDSNFQFYTIISWRELHNVIKILVCKQEDRKQHNPGSDGRDLLTPETIIKFLFFPIRYAHE